MTAPVPRADAPLAADVADQLGALYREHRSRVVAYARLGEMDAALADDIASETWLALASRLRRGRLRAGPALPRLLRMMVTCAIAAHFRFARNRECPVAWWADPTTVDARFPASPSADRVAPDYDGPHFPARLRQAIDALPDAWRWVVEFRSEGMLYAAVASHVGCTDVRVRQIEKATMRALRPVVTGERDLPAVPERACACLGGRLRMTPSTPRGLLGAA
ncbi:RNA polymerase sigma factor [Streptomyces chrestomyceticus]|uniref:RNA polymerase sigma factor n=1 Tax=Streptomyces chrestomyceticus TaxID=68185 RepID=UPI0037B12940